MAFVSYTRQNNTCPNIRFWLTKTAATGKVSSATGLRGKRLEIQLDEEKKIIRIQQSEDKRGLIVSKGGGFGCAKKLYEKVGSSVVTLELKEDGWLYGSYEGVES